MAGVMTAVTKWETVGNCVSKSIDGICGAFKGVWSEQELKSMVSALKFELERERQYFQNELLKKEEEIKGANEKVVQAIRKRMLDVKDMYEEKEKCIKKLIESFEEKLEAKDNQIVDTNKRLYTCQAESLEKILENMAKHEQWQNKHREQYRILVDTINQVQNEGHREVIKALENGNARAERIECEKQGKIEKNEERCDKMLYDKDELLRQMQNRFIDEVKGAQKNLAETSWRVVEKIEKHTTRANDRLAEKDRLISSVQDKIYESFKESNKREIQMRKEMQKREDDHVEKLYEKHHADRKQDRLCYDDCIKNVKEYHSLFEKLLYGSLKQLKDMSHENQKHHQQLIDVMQRHQMSTEKLLRDQIEEANRRDKLERDFSFNKELMYTNSITNAMLMNYISGSKLTPCNQNQPIGLLAAQLAGLDLPNQDHPQKVIQGLAFQQQEQLFSNGSNSTSSLPVELLAQRIVHYLSSENQRDEATNNPSPIPSESSLCVEELAQRFAKFLQIEDRQNSR